MARSGRLVWTKFVLRAVPIYAMLAENLPIWARKEIDAICRKFFWAGSDQSIRGKCMVAWPEVCRPTQLGGLGISDLKLTSYALQTKWATANRPRQSLEPITYPDYSTGASILQSFNFHSHW